MIIKRCTFDQLPYAMQMHDLYIEKIPVAEYRLAIWSNKDTLYYNELKESEVKRFVTLIESEKRFLNNRTMDRPSIPYCDKLLKAMSHLADKGHYKFKEWSTDQAYIYFMGYLLGSGKLKWEGQLS